IEAFELAPEGEEQPPDAFERLARRWLAGAVFLRDDHRDDLAPAGNEISQEPGGFIGQLAHRELHRGGKAAMTAASIVSVLARLPSALAKERTCAGLTTTTGRPAAESSATASVSSPPLASSATRSGLSSRSRAAS